MRPTKIGVCSYSVLSVVKNEYVSVGARRVENSLKIIAARMYAMIFSKLTLAKNLLLSSRSLGPFLGVEILTQKKQDVSYFREVLQKEKKK